MDEYDPDSLPAVDAVEIVDIRRLNPNRVSEYMQIARAEPCVRLEGEPAQAIAAAWRELPMGQSARCHTPPIGMRYIVDGRTYLEASVCWRCNNLYGLEEGCRVMYAFDSESEPAKRLFSLVGDAMGEEVLGEG